MKMNFLKGKAFGGRIISALSVIFIVLLLLLNLLLTNIGQDKMLILDTTYEGLYTLTPLMKEECAFVDKLDGKVKITFCSDPDTLISSAITRVAYFMALQLENFFENIEVETVNVIYNPTAVSKYKSTSLKEISPTDIIVSYGDRYRITNADRFWITSGGEYAAFCGEYRLATLFRSVTAVNRPKAYFVIDHGETYYDGTDPDREENADASYLYDMLVDRGLEVETLELSKIDEIPSDCVLLVINNPREDFSVYSDRLDEFDYISDTEKLDKYLVRDQGAIMIAKDYSITLPVFEEFLYEWGFDTSSSLVRDESSSLIDETNSHTEIVAQYDKDENSYGYAIYGEFASLSSAPSMVFKNTGYISCSYGEAEGTNEPGSYTIARNYAPFFFTTENAVAYEKNESGEYLFPSVSGRLDLAAVTVRMALDSYTGEYEYSYVFCANSGDFFSEETLGNYSFVNYEVMSSLVENMIRIDEYASMELGSESQNSSNRGGKILLDTTMYTYDTIYDGDNNVYKGLTDPMIVLYTVILAVIPVAVAAVGIYVRVRRKFL